MALVKWKVPLPSIQLRWKKPPHGNDVLHNVNFTDTRTTVLWASQLILLCCLPEQTFIRKGEQAGRGKEIKNKKKTFRVNKTGTQNTTLRALPKKSILHFKVGIAAPVALGLLLSGCPQCSPSPPAALRTPPPLLPTGTSCSALCARWGGITQKS